MKSNVRGIIVALLGCSSVALYTGLAGEFGSNTYVQVSVSFPQKTLRPGQAGTLQVKFKPAEDIHINSEPAVRIKLTSELIVSLAGRLHQEVDKSSGYLSTHSPLTQRFMVSKHARPGTHTVKGSLVYYYCSDSDGLCRKQVEPLELTLTIAP